MEIPTKEDAMLEMYKDIKYLFNKFYSFIFS